MVWIVEDKDGRIVSIHSTNAYADQAAAEWAKVGIEMRVDTYCLEH